MILTELVRLSIEGRSEGVEGAVQAVKYVARQRTLAIRGAILVLLMSLSPAVLFATQPQVILGFKVGGGLSDLRGDWYNVEHIYETPISPKHQFGFSGGMFAQIALGHHGFVLQPELLYVMKGSKTEFPEGLASDFGVVMKVKMSYCEVPVLVKLNIPTRGSLTPNVFVGPVAALNLLSRIEFENVPPQRSGDFEEGNIENAKMVDLGITFGSGVDFSLGLTSMLTFDVRYTRGFLSVCKYVGHFEANKIYWTTLGHGIRLMTDNIQAMVGCTFW
ncbi:MAG: porin family protein [candidate division Zixibacteria bacterium]|nr:porin family protein [candidate division Zixibacteria bacterium]